MDTTDGAGEEDGKHKRLFKWAKEHGIIIEGVRAAKIPHKGLGIIAERPIKVRFP